MSFLITHTTRVNPKVNGEPWVILIFQHRFIDCNKHTIPVGDADSGEERACER